MVVILFSLSLIVGQLKSAQVQDAHHVNRMWSEWSCKNEDVIQTKNWALLYVTLNNVSSLLSFLHNYDNYFLLICNKKTTKLHGLSELSHGV